MREFLTKILKIIFVISLVLLVLSITLKNTVLSTISIGITKKDITERILDVAMDSFPELDSATLDKIKSKINSSDEMDKIANTYFNALLYDIKNDTVSSVDITKEINLLLNNNLKELPSNYRQVIISIVNNIDFNNLYPKLLDYVKSKTTFEIRQILDVFSIYTSEGFLSVLCLLLFISIIFIIILSHPVTEVFYNFGIPLLVSGAIMIILLFVLRKMFSYIIAMAYGSSMTTSLTLLTIIGFSSLIVGIIMIDIYERFLDKEFEPNAKKSHLNIKKNKQLK